MNVLLFGAGVINTLYAWAFARAGHRVTLFVRPGRESQWAQGIELDVLDLRKGQGQVVRERFTPRVIASWDADLPGELPSDGEAWDLIQVSVKHTQLEGALATLQGAPPGCPLLFLHNNWLGLQTLDRFLPRSRYAIGLPRAGGAIAAGVLRGALLDDVPLGDSLCGRSDATAQETEAAHGVLAKAIALHASAGIAATVHGDMERWQQVHFATTAAWIAGAAKARGFEAFSHSPAKIHEALLLGREAMQVCVARGIDPGICADARPFQAPPWLSALITWLVLRGPAVQRISAGHGAYAAEELRQIFLDVLETGEGLGVALPRMRSMRGYIDEMVAHGQPAATDHSAPERKSPGSSSRRS